jgi:Protein of unknown function (DUF998)
VVAVVQGLLRPGYSFVAHPVVALVAGPSGWVQDENFVVLGAAMIAFAIGLHLGVRPTRWAVVGAALFALSGIGPLWAGVAGPRPAHFLLNFLGAAIGLIVLSRPMARDPSWQRLAGYALTTDRDPGGDPDPLPPGALRRRAAAPVVGPVQLVGDHALAHLHGRPRTQTPARRQERPLDGHDRRTTEPATGKRRAWTAVMCSARPDSRRSG